MDLLATLRYETHFESELRRKQLRKTWTNCMWNFQHWTYISMVQVSITGSRKPAHEGIKKRYLRKKSRRNGWR